MERRDDSTSPSDALPLRSLDDLEVADGHTDIRGWSVSEADGSLIGTVSELLVDTDAMRVRYLDLALVHGDEGAHARVPIEAVRIDDDQRTVTVANVSQIAASGGTHGMEEVGVARRSLTDGRTASASTPMSTSTSTEQEIRVPVTEEEVVVTKRPVVKEELVIRTRLVTQEHVVEADVRRERVDVDREQR